jgi:DNA-binding CsgD family transcriptional regulator
VEPFERSSSDAPITALTPRQREIVILIAAGLTNQDIADRLGTTPGGVGTQVGRIVQRLGLTRRAEIAEIAVWVVLPRVDQSPG